MHHCWNCGNVGHQKEDCPDPPSGLTKGQIRRRRKFANRRPAASINTSAIVNSNYPFGAWVDALFEGIDMPAAEKAITVLPCAESDTRPDHDIPDGPAVAAAASDGPWTVPGGGAAGVDRAQRKMTWLVAVRGVGDLETAMPWLSARGGGGSGGRSGMLPPATAEAVAAAPAVGSIALRSYMY